MDRLIFKLILITVAGVTLAACTIAERHRDHESIQDDDYAAYAAHKNGTDQALDELGWAPSRRLTSDETDALELRVRLNRLERDIATERERGQYFSLKPYFENDGDRAHYLELPSFEARERFAMEKGISPHSGNFSPEVKEAISRSDVIVGMNREAVIESWGEPADVSVAGSRVYGNERWTYIHYTPTTEGYEKEERTLIFESGRVVGWHKEQ